MTVKLICRTLSFRDLKIMNARMLGEDLLNLLSKL